MKLIKGLLVISLLLVAAISVYSRSREETSGSVPIINSDQDPLIVSCEYTSEDLLKGLTAYDAEDGYITDSIIPGSFSPFKEKGISELDYYVYDSNDNCGRYKREVVFSDYRSPKVMLSYPLMFYAKDASDGYLMDSIFGDDRLDGDVKHIKLNGSDIDYETAGDYTISVSLINSFGDAATYDLPVHIIKKTANKGLDIRLNENLIYIQSGAEFHPEDLVKEIELNQTEELIPRENWVFSIQSTANTSNNGEYEGSDTESRQEDFVKEATSDQEEEPIPQEEWKIDVRSNVDTSKAGVYEVRYLINKENDAVYGNVSGIIWLTVIVIYEGA